MAKTYLPEEITSSKCVVVVSDGHFRVYASKPNGRIQNDVITNDYYARENYIMSSTTTNFSTFTSYNCLDETQFTTDYWYREDIDGALLMFFIFAIVLIYFPFKLFSRFFGRWLKI